MSEIDCVPSSLSMPLEMTILTLVISTSMMMEHVVAEAEVATIGVVVVS